MVLTPSTMLTLGTTAAEFQLPDVVTGRTVVLQKMIEQVSGINQGDSVPQAKFINELFGVVA